MNTTDLKGKRIVSSAIDADKGEILLVDSTGDRYWLSAVGDCCSSSWFEHVTGLVAPFTITEEMELHPDETAKTWDKDEIELTRVYSVKLATDKGYAELELRNSSNGYYGGWVEYSQLGPTDQYGNAKDDAPKMLEIRGDL